MATRARDISQGSNAPGAITLSTLTTSNVTEGSNLYFTNARVYANISLANIDILYDVDTSTSKPTSNQALIWNATVNRWVPGNVLIANTDLLREGNVNLYYTNARARSAITPLNDTIIYDKITGSISANVNFIANLLTGNTTDVVPEGVSNKYFTNARVDARIATTNIDALFDVDFSYAAPANNKVLVYNTIINRWVAGDYGVGFADTADVANTVNTLDNFTTSNLAEGVNLYYTNARVDARILANLDLANTIANAIAIANINLNGTFANVGTFRANLVIANVITSNILNVTNIVAIGSIQSNTWIGLYTANVIETSGNLYFTNARVDARLANLSINNLSDVFSTNNLSVGKVLAWTGTKWEPTTVTANANVSGGSTSGNLSGEYANISIFRANIIFANVITTNTLNVTNIVANGSITGLNSITANIWNNLYSANVTESGTNLYFTNVRVYANIAPLLTTANVREIASNLYFSNDRVYANIAPLLTTANVAEVTNQYFTNVRVINALIGANVGTGDLTVVGNLNLLGYPSYSYANLSVSNLFTKSRTLTLASEAKTPTQAQDAGIYLPGANANISYSEAGDTWRFNKDITIFGNVLPSSSGIFNLGSFTQKWKSLFIGAQTLYVGNVGVGEVSNSVILTNATNVNDISGIIVSNVVGVYNITVDRTIPLSNTESIGYIGGNVLQYVSNTTGNLYLGVNRTGNINHNKFSGVRIQQTRVDSGNVRSDVIIYNDNEKTNNSIARVSILGDGNTNIIGNVYIDANSSLNSNLIGNITSQVGTFGNIIVGNIIANVGYYSTVRTTNANVTALISNSIISNSALITNITTTVFVSNSIVGNTALVSNINSSNVRTHSITSNIWTGIYTANVIESTSNLYFTNARVYANIAPLLTTANVAEVTNLYYTNARVRSTLSSGTGVSYDTSTGQISIGQNVSSTANVTFGSLTVTGNIYIQGNSSYVNSNTLVLNDPLIQLGYGNPSDSYDLGILGHYNDGIERHAGIFRDASDGGKFKLFANLTGEPSVNIIDTANASFRLAPLVASYFEGNVTGTVSTLSNFTTSNLVEGANLYFTNTRSRATISAGIGIIYDSVTGVITANLVSLANALTSNTTDLVPEGFYNLYYSNARVNAYIQPWLTTANVIESTSNLYYTNTRSRAAISAGTGIIYDAANGIITANLVSVNDTITNLTTTDIAEGANLYFTNARVFSNVSLMSINVFADVNITGQQSGYGLIWDGNNWVANIITVSGTELSNVANSVLNIVQAQISGLQANNAIFSNTAAFANISNIANIVVSISNFTTANLAEATSNLYYTNARVFGNVTSTLAGNVSIGNVNISSSGTINYSNNFGTVKVYQYYNQSTGSLDTVFI
jgi:hypothetical protein